MGSWLDKDGCGNCNYCGMDMDLDPFCVNQQVLQQRSEHTGRSYDYGLDINVAYGLCKGIHFVVRSPQQ